ncbi:hypothetical protein [Burkholderia cenocepacia]|uniref:hypothetical protein n=1 Tax=Burkholderia cenocepacia TaxID=95486 RepID=UPI0026545078|nr:hypothetical protein [Burkholderia cenocepacia]MDN7537032.1 hypothetical protein [Burkholderia cenocepacia]
MFSWLSTQLARRRCYRMGYECVMTMHGDGTPRFVIMLAIAEAHAETGYTSDVMRGAWRALENLCREV